MTSIDSLKYSESYPSLQQPIQELSDGLFNPDKACSSVEHLCDHVNQSTKSLTKFISEIFYHSNLEIRNLNAENKKLSEAIAKKDEAIDIAIECLESNGFGKLYVLELLKDSLNKD